MADYTKQIEELTQLAKSTLNAKLKCSIHDRDDMIQICRIKAWEILQRHGDKPEEQIRKIAIRTFHNAATKWFLREITRKERELASSISSGGLFGANPEFEAMLGEQEVEDFVHHYLTTSSRFVDSCRLLGKRGIYRAHCKLKRVQSESQETFNA